MRTDSEVRTERWLAFCFAAAAVSWVPHFACHYYRLETRSSFAVGEWDFSRSQSSVFLGMYAALIVLNLGSIVNRGWRLWASSLTGLGHLAIGGLHWTRLFIPFRFEVFDHPWPASASLREAALVTPLGAAGLGLFVYLRCAEPRRRRVERSS